MAERGNVSVARLFRGGDVRWQRKAPRLKTRATSDGASCRGTACGARPKVENGSLSTEVSGTMTKELIRMKVNGELREIAAPAEKLLLDVLREDLSLTGSKRGCDDSSCGCCAVLVDGVPMLSCVAIASCYQHCEIVTVEGIAPRSEEHTSELQSLRHLVCRLLLEKKKKKTRKIQEVRRDTVKHESKD